MIFASALILVAACSSSHTTHRGATPSSDQANLIAPSGCSRSAPAGTAQHSVQVGNATRRYSLATPKPTAGNALLPAVFDFTSDRRASLGAAAAARGWVVVTPEPNRSDWSSADVNYVSAVLADVGARLCLDPARVFAAGMSNGGAFATELLCAMPGTFAAAGVVAGEWTQTPCNVTARPASLVAFHGGNDRVAPYRGNTSSRPVERAVADWAGWDGCVSFRTTGLSLAVRRLQFTGCRRGTGVDLYTVADAAHEWPEVPALDTTRVMLDFFAAHPRPAE